MDTLEVRLDKIGVGYNGHLRDKIGVGYNGHLRGKIR